MQIVEKSIDTEGAADAFDIKVSIQFTGWELIQIEDALRAKAIAALAFGEVANAVKLAEAVEAIYRKLQKCEKDL